MKGHYSRMVMALREAACSLLSFRFRALLSLSGIIIGCASVIATLNTGYNAARDTAKAFSAQGAELFSLRPEWREEALYRPRAISPLLQNTGTEGAFWTLAGISTVNFSLLVKGREESVTVLATTPALQAILGLHLHQGRFFSRWDDHARYAVIGHTLATKMGIDGDLAAHPQRVPLGSYYYQVIGVLAPWLENPLIPYQINDAIIVPLSGANAIRIPERPDLILGKSSSKERVVEASEQSAALLRALPFVGNVTTFVPQQLLLSLQHQERNFNLLLLALGAITLVGGGIGIMNTMMMSVSSRRVETGLRMAIGASKSAILSLFMLEASLLAFSGTALGAIIGMVLSWGYALAMGWQFALSPYAVPLGSFSALLTGVFFGLYPAWRAASLQPAEALRDG